MTSGEKTKDRRTKKGGPRTDDEMRWRLDHIIIPQREKNKNKAHKLDERRTAINKKTE
jgi:hypothetical protein